MYLQRHSILRRTRGWLIAMVSLFASLNPVMIGCSTAADRLLSAPLEHGSVDDHLAAAAVYQQEAQRLDTEAQRYADEAAAITPLEDTKGFRRNALMRTAQNFLEKAREMQQLYAAHALKAETMMGMQPRQ
jgi:hypothetical protein